MDVSAKTSRVLRSELLCRGCGATWEYTGTIQNTMCPYCGKPKDARDRREEAQKYARAPERKQRLVDWYADRDNRRARQIRYTALLRKRVFFRISGSINPVCTRCGCDDSRLIEINHKAGGGKKKEGGNFKKLYVEIASGRRDTEDLELLCRPCNAIHYLESKYGPLPMNVAWTGGGLI